MGRGAEKRRKESPLSSPLMDHSVSPSKKMKRQKRVSVEHIAYGENRDENSSPWPEH